MRSKGQRSIRSAVAGGVDVATAAQSKPDLIITGVPFSGATLVRGLLNRLPDVVAIDAPETWNDLLDIQDPDLQCRSVVERFAEIRHALAHRHGHAATNRRSGLFSRLVPHRQHESPILHEAGLEEAFKTKKHLPPEFTVAVTSRYLIACSLATMAHRFRCCAVVRNPLAVLSEWRVRGGPLRQGREPRIEKLDPGLTTKLQAATNDLERRIILLDWYFGRFSKSSTSMIVQRYEDVVASNGGSLATVLTSAGAIPGLPGSPLRDGNADVREDRDIAKKELEALVGDREHACWAFYRPTEVEDVLNDHGERPRFPSRSPSTVGKDGGEQRYRPMIDFMILGAQKCGTTALWAYLRAHPEVSMSTPKEVHLFSSPAYRKTWSPKEIDRRSRRWFRPGAETRVRGEATPMYLFLPDVAPELKRYNPDLKLIVLVRDPVERTISHYYMQLARGREKASIWLAMLAEPWRLRRCGDLRGGDSAFRIHSYRTRSLYSLQLRNLYRHFSHDRVLVISSHHLQTDHRAVLRQVFSFLGVSDDFTVPEHTAMSGDLYGRRNHPILSAVLRLSFLAERWRGRGLYEL